MWRTLYVGKTRLSCYLEVLAYARTSDDLSAALDEIVDDDEFPTIAPGRVPRSWMSSRVTGSGTITGWFVVPGDTESVATPRTLFRPHAIRLGLLDLDTAAIRDGRPRALTQAISQWVNTVQQKQTSVMSAWKKSLSGPLPVFHPARIREAMVMPPNVRSASTVTVNGYRANSRPSGLPHRCIPQPAQRSGVGDVQMHGVLVASHCPRGRGSVLVAGPLREGEGSRYEDALASQATGRAGADITSAGRGYGRIPPARQRISPLPAVRRS
ncbi:hypothetical protein [Rhodococcus rhodochrous]|uniref:hypothetical protein n=1 Tax=Rhodococcus rhodochrous TaxID=1829 RepID=UPI001D02A94F|nr:hypothetical protein [Rhodococcus rhodochrous]